MQNRGGDFETARRVFTAVEALGVVFESLPWSCSFVYEVEAAFEKQIQHVPNFLE